MLLSKVNGGIDDTVRKYCIIYDGGQRSNRWAESRVERLYACIHLGIHVRDFHRGTRTEVERNWIFRVIGMSCFCGRRSK